MTQLLKRQHKKYWVKKKKKTEQTLYKRSTHDHKAKFNVLIISS